MFGNSTRTKDGLCYGCRDCALAAARKSEGNLRQNVPLYLYSRIKKTAMLRKIDFSLTLDEISKIWEDQKGLCFYSGVRLSTGGLSLATIDRTDSSKGYTKDNVKIVSWLVNIAKNKHTEEEFVEMVKRVAEHFLKMKQ